MTCSTFFKIENRSSDRLCHISSGEHRIACAGRHKSGRMTIFLWTLYKPHPTAPEENTRRKAITKLIEAVAEQQEALARILEAEHKKSKR